MSNLELPFLKSDNDRVFLVNCEVENDIYFGLGYFDCMLPDRLIVFTDNQRYLIEIPEEVTNKYTSSIIVNGYLKIL